MANARLDVREKQDEVTFLYKVVPGAAQKSYGLYVAKLAGLPPDVVERAKTLVAEFEAVAGLEAQPPPSSGQQQISEHIRRPRPQLGQAVLDRLAQVDPLRTTPIDALLLVAELQRVAEGGEEGE